MNGNIAGKNNEQQYNGREYCETVSRPSTINNSIPDHQQWTILSWSQARDNSIMVKNNEHHYHCEQKMSWAWAINNSVLGYSNGQHYQGREQRTPVSS